MADDKLIKTLRHYINLELYANGVAADINEILLELYMQCDNAILSRNYINTKNEYTLLRQLINEYLLEFRGTLSDRLEKEAEIVKEKERDFLGTLYGTLLVVGAVSLSKVLFTPFDGRDTVKSFADRTVKNIARTYDTALRSGYIFGQKASDVKEMAEKNLNQVTNGIKNGIITAVPSFAKTTDKIVFLNNDKEMIWVATLDGSTCLECMSYSGQRFHASDMPPLPLHDRCRCIAMPADEIKNPLPSFEEYIKSLDDDGQKHALGPKRYKLWKEYNMPLNKFLNDGRIIPLKDLK